MGPLLLLPPSPLLLPPLILPPPPPLRHRAPLFPSTTAASNPPPPTSPTSTRTHLPTLTGGWMLLVTQLDAVTGYAGSVTPWTVDLNPTAPSKTAAYSRKWGATGVDLLPVAGDQIMIARSSNDAYTYMTLSSWCGGTAWTSQNAGCGGVNHPGHGEGSFYVGTSTSAAATTTYLNGCSETGGCGSSGSDGIGFSTFNGWANGPDNCYGGAQPPHPSSPPNHPYEPSPTHPSSPTVLLPLFSLNSHLTLTHEAVPSHSYS